MAGQAATAACRGSSTRHNANWQERISIQVSKQVHLHGCDG